MTEIRKTTGASAAPKHAKPAGGANQTVSASTSSAPFRRTSSAPAAQRTERSAAPVRRTAASSASQTASGSAQVKRTSGTTQFARTTSASSKAKAAAAGKAKTTAAGKAKAAAAGARSVSGKKKNKSGTFLDNPVVSRIQQLIPKNVNWPLILVIAISVLILIGIIFLMSIGISRCSDGCSGSAPSAQSTIKPQIHLTATATPSPTADVSQPITPGTSDPYVPAQNVVVPSNGLRQATIRTIGDFVIHKEVFLNAQRLAKSTNVDYAYNFAPMLDPVWDVLGNADFTVANVDGCLGGKDAYRYGYSGYPQINTPPCLLYALRDSSVDMLTLANNHMLDGWFDGLMKTIANVESVNIKHIGASRTQEERDTPVIQEVNGIKIGLLNYTESLNEMDKKDALDKRAMEFAVHAVKNSDCMVDAKKLREAGADVIVCFMHWGTEYELEPDRDQEAISQKLVECGVDVIIGGHPHVVQGAQWLSGTNQFGERQETLCMYSLGNFLSFQRGQYKDGGVIFDFTIQEQPDGSFSIINPGYLPTWVWMTGDDEDNYNFQVLNINDYINNPPPTMTNADYQKMLQSYNDSLSAMSKGVGTLLTK